MERITVEVNACQRCDLWMRRRNAVPGEGDLEAVVIFIGEAPGHWEDVKGRPFVGTAGKLLNELLLKAGLSRAEVYITNVLKCRPPENRDPRPSEIKACTPFLKRQITLIKPILIVTLGRHSTSYILQKMGFETGGITGIHGKIFNGELFDLKVRVIPTFHPAAALYNPRYKEGLEVDFKVVQRQLESSVKTF
jgi:uracil-DNA glycosylase family 4